MTDATHAYVVVQGDFPDTPAESWQFGVRFMLVNSGTAPDNSGTLPTFAVTPAAVSRTETDWVIESTWNADLGLTETISVDDWLNDQLAPAIVDNIAGLKVSSKVRVLRIKASPITASGHVADLRTSILQWTGSNPVGSVSVPMLPSEVSCVVSWGTPVIGRKGRGRIYLPPSGAALLNDDGQFTSTDTANVLAGAVAMLEEMAITPTGPGNHWALPIVTGSPWTHYGVITAVTVGSILDSQRRRRRQLVEVRAGAATSYG